MKVLIFFTMLFLISCTNLVGDNQLVGVDKQKRLVGAWKLNESLDYIKKGESLTITLDNAFFSHLPDIGQSNEVAIIVDITENGKTITKVLGPIEGTADKSYFNQMARRIYGPKKLSDEFLEIGIKVIEIDTDENEDQKGFVDFVKKIAEPLFLADPVTAGEITLAAEVAKTLIDLNQNDYIIDFNFTLVTKDGDHRYTLPLTEGIMGLVNREHERGFSNDYFYNTRIKGTSVFNPITLGMDILMVPLVAITSISDNVTSLATVRFTEDSEGIYINNDDKKGLLLSEFTHEIISINSKNELIPYNDKSWLVLSFHKGFDTSFREKNEAISENVDNITKLLRRSPADVFKNRNELNNAISNLLSVKETLEKGNIFPKKYKSDKTYPYEFSVRIPSEYTRESVNYYIKNKAVIEKITDSVQVPEEGWNRYAFKIQKPTNQGASDKLEKGDYNINVITTTGKTFTYLFSIVE